MIINFLGGVSCGLIAAGAYDDRVPFGGGGGELGSAGGMLLLGVN